MRVDIEWRLSDAALTSKEKVELLAILREALMNVRKHAIAGTVKIICTSLDGGNGFICSVEDDGIGTSEERLTAKGCYGVRMMRGRAEAMGWELDYRSTASIETGSLTKGTVVEIRKRG